jgi:hypothetical protein
LEIGVVVEIDGFHHIIKSVIYRGIPRVCENVPHPVGIEKINCRKIGIREDVRNFTALANPGGIEDSPG